MTDIIISGCAGKMGVSILNASNSRSDCKITIGVDIVKPQNFDGEYAKSFSELSELNKKFIEANEKLMEIRNEIDNVNKKLENPEM